jgi:CRP-like cAMP-binding protein
MWVGLLAKIKQNRQKFYDKEGNLINVDLSATATEKSKKKVVENKSITTPLSRKRTRIKWRSVFQKITKAMHAVSTMQHELKLKRQLGEVEPSPLLVALSELSRRACYTTERNSANGNVLGHTRLKRPGHADHAPVLLNDNKLPEAVAKDGQSPPLQKFFQFSTDVLGHAFKVAVMPVLTKQPEDRTDSDIHAVAHIMRSLHFFTVLEDDALNFLLSSSTLHTLNAGEVLYKRGDDPQMVSVILRGTVSVVVRHMGMNFTACDLYSGTSVGEEAVASGNNQKNTVMATKPTLLLALPRYPELLCRIKNEMVEIKVQFLKSISILNGVVSPESLRLLAEQLRVVRVKDNQAVTKEGAPITHLLFVKSGHLRTLKKIQHPERPGRHGRNLLVEVQSLAPTDFFGENSFRHMPLNTMRSMRNMRLRRRRGSATKLGSKEHREPQTYGTYLASIVSQTYSELYEVPITTVHAILSKEAVQNLTTYGNERERLYKTPYLQKSLLNTLNTERRKEIAMKSETSL